MILKSNLSEGRKICLDVFCGMGFFYFFLEKSMPFIESVVKDRSNSRNSSRV